MKAYTLNSDEMIEKGRARWNGCWFVWMSFCYISMMSRIQRDVWIWCCILLSYGLCMNVCRIPWLLIALNENLLIYMYLAVTVAVEKRWRRKMLSSVGKLSEMRFTVKIYLRNEKHNLSLFDVFICVCQSKRLYCYPWLFSIRSLCFVCVFFSVSRQTINISFSLHRFYLPKCVRLCTYMSHTQKTGSQNCIRYYLKNSTMQRTQPNF